MSKGTILIIEDNKEFRTIYGDRLQNDGYEILEADNGEEGLMKLRSAPVNLVISDIVMPKMDGRQVIAEIAKDPVLKNIPVIMMSVLGDKTEIANALAAGAADYLVKGMYTPNDVLAKINATLARSANNALKVTYTLGILPGKHDAAKLAKDFEYIHPAACPSCGTEKKIELTVKDAARGTFDAKLICQCPA